MAWSTSSPAGPPTNGRAPSPCPHSVPPTTSAAAPAARPPSTPRALLARTWRCASTARKATWAALPRPTGHSARSRVGAPAMPASPPATRSIPSTASRWAGARDAKTVSTTTPACVACVTRTSTSWTAHRPTPSGTAASARPGPSCVPIAAPSRCATTAPTASPPPVRRTCVTWCTTDPCHTGWTGTIWLPASRRGARRWSMQACATGATVPITAHCSCRTRSVLAPA